MLVIFNKFELFVDDLLSFPNCQAIQCQLLGKTFKFNSEESLKFFLKLNLKQEVI